MNLIRNHRIWLLSLFITAIGSGVSYSSSFSASSSSAPIITPKPITPPVVNPPPAPVDPVLQAAAAAYLSALQYTPGALAALRALTGISFPAANTTQLTPDQVQTLYGMLFNADGSHSSAYTNPVQSAESLVPALTALQTFQSTKGTLAAFQTLDGQTAYLPPTGTLLNTPEIQFLYTQLFDAQGNQTLAYSNPKQASANINAGANYLIALQANNGAGINLLNSLVAGENLPKSGPLTVAQVQFLFTQLFVAKLDANGNPIKDANGNVITVPTTAYNNPTAAIKNLQAAANYLAALRANGDAGLNALNALTQPTGQGLPPSGGLTSAQLTLLFGQLFGPVNPRTGLAAVTQAYTNPTATVATLVAAETYLTTLRQTANALNAYNDLTGQGVLGNGPLTSTQLTYLIGQLFTTNPKTTYTGHRRNPSPAIPSQAYTDPAAAVATIIAADNYLMALRAANPTGTSGIAALNELTGLNLSAKGGLNSAQLTTFFGLLYTPQLDANGNIVLVNGKPVAVPSQAYTDPSGAAATLEAGANYLTALRATNISGTTGIAALNELTGFSLPATGALNINPYTANNPTSQLTQFLGLLYNSEVDANGNIVLVNGKPVAVPSQAYTDPSGAAATLEAGANYLTALRATNISGTTGIAALNELTGFSLPATGALNINPYTANNPTSQLTQFLGLLYNSEVDANNNIVLVNGKPVAVQSQAYTDPSGAAATLEAGANYLTALRANNGAGIAALDTLTGFSLPATGALNINPYTANNPTSQLTTFLGLLYNSEVDANGNVVLVNGKPVAVPSQAYSDPNGSAATLVAGVNYLTALRANNGAGIAALDALTGFSLPATGALNINPYTANNPTSQLTQFLSLLYNFDGSASVANTTPATAVATLIAGENYLTALRANNGAGLAALNALTGFSLPSTGALSTTPGPNNQPSQLSQFLSLLFALSDPTNPNSPVISTLAGSNPTVATANLVAANNYLTALRANPAALMAFNDLFGLGILENGVLTMQQLAGLFDQLFTPELDANGNEVLDANGNIVTVTLTGYSNPQQAMLDLIAADNYLMVLRANPAASAAFYDLTGTQLGNGPLTSTQLTALFAQLYTKDAKGNVVQTTGYNNPQQALANLLAADNYLMALRQNPAALSALEELTGQNLPTVADTALSMDQINFLFEQLFNADGSTSTAYGNPAQATQYLVHAGAYLDALRSTPGALSALETTSGHALPASGPLTTSQIQFLFSLLFDANGQPTLAYTNPTQAAKNVAQSQKPKLILIILGALVAGAAVGYGLSKTGLPTSVVTALGVGIVGAIIGIGLHLGASSGSNTPTPAVTVSTTTVSGASLTPASVPAVLPPNPGSTSPTRTPSGGTPISRLTIVSPASRFVGSTPLSQAYAPIFNSVGNNQIQNPEAIKDIYAEGRWLATAKGGHVSSKAAQAALGYASAADKNVTVVTPTEPQPIDINQ